MFVQVVGLRLVNVDDCDVNLRWPGKNFTLLARPWVRWTRRGFL